MQATAGQPCPDLQTEGRRGRAAEEGFSRKPWLLLSKGWQLLSIASHWQQVFSTSKRVGLWSKCPNPYEHWIACDVFTQKQRRVPNVASSRRQHQSGSPLSVLRRLDRLLYTVSSGVRSLVVATNTFWYLNAGQRIAHSRLAFTRPQATLHRQRTEPKHQTLNNPLVDVQVSIAKPTKRTVCARSEILAGEEQVSIRGAFPDMSYARLRKQTAHIHAVQAKLTQSQDTSDTDSSAPFISWKKHDNFSSCTVSAGLAVVKLDPDRHCHCRLASSCNPSCHCHQFGTESGYRCISSFFGPVQFPPSHPSLAQSCTGAFGSHEGRHSNSATSSYSTNTCGRLPLWPSPDCAIQLRSRVSLR